MKKLLLLGSLGLVVVLALAGSLSGASAGEPPETVELAFHKEAVSPNTYVGKIDGGGTIDVMVLERRDTKTAQYFNALFRVDVGDKWFATVLHGSFEFANSQTHLKGIVTHGNWLQGVRVREEGKLVGSSPPAFDGTLNLTSNHGGDDSDVAGAAGDPADRAVPASFAERRIAAKRA
jgi:hypothetical protein